MYIFYITVKNGSWVCWFGASILGGIRLYVLVFTSNVITGSIEEHWVLERNHNTRW